MKLQLFVTALLATVSLASPLLGPGHKDHPPKPKPTGKPKPTPTPTTTTVEEPTSTPTTTYTYDTSLISTGTSTPLPAEPPKIREKWQQCGGQGWDEFKYGTCVEGLTCTYLNVMYSQCL